MLKEKTTFKTRKEARTFCRMSGIPLKNIWRSPEDGKWIVTNYQSQERTPVAGFQIGCMYKLIDRKNIIDIASSVREKAGIAMIADIIGDSAIQITKVNGTRNQQYEFMIVGRRGESYTINSKYAPAFYQVEKPTTAAPIHTPEDLDSMLNGGSSMESKAVPVESKTAPLTTERDPDIFVSDRSYSLVNREGFVCLHRSNLEIVSRIDQEFDGVYTVLYDIDNPYGFYLKGKDGHKIHLKHESAFLSNEDRQFFRELPDSSPSLPVSVDAQKKQLNEELNELYTKHRDALTAVDDVLTEICQVQTKLNAL